MAWRVGVVWLCVLCLPRQQALRHLKGRPPASLLRVSPTRQTETRLHGVNVLATLQSGLSVAGVVAFHEAGHFLAARSQGMKVQSFNVGYGPKLFAFNDSSNTEFALRAVPLGGYVAFPSNVELSDEGEIVRELDDPDLLQNRPPLQRAWVISAGVVANILLTFLLATGTAWVSGLGHPTYNNGVMVTTTPDVTSAGYTAGIRANDIITRLNGEELLGSERTVDRFIKVIRASADKPILVEVLRSSPATGAGAGTGAGVEATTSSAKGGRAQTLQFTVVPKPTAGGKGAIGLGINARVKKVETVRAHNLAEAVSMGGEETWRLISFTWNAFTQSLQAGFQGSEVGGPISVVKAGAQMAESSPQALVGFAATLSVNLAILNALPFPALDGGQLAFVLIEILAGKPVPRKAKDAITAVAFSFLLALGASTLLGDIARVGEPSSIVIRPPPETPSSK